MTELDRLTVLIEECAAIHESGFDPDKRISAEALARYLLANGAIVMPCKIGCTVYYIHEELTMAGTKTVISTRKITGYGGNGLNPVWMVSAVPYELRFHPSEFGRTVFLTREEAEAELKKRRKEKKRE
jgi:hypothetical protein